MIKKDFYTGSGINGLGWWQKKSGLTSGSITDHIYTALGKYGYTGSVNDRVLAWGGDLFGDHTLGINDVNYLLVKNKSSYNGNGTMYYVKTGGSDAADGLSDANAWATISKVNAATFADGKLLHPKTPTPSPPTLSSTQTTHYNQGRRVKRQVCK